MNGLNKLGLSLGALALGVVFASAQPMGGRVFTYEVTSTVDMDASMMGAVVLDTPTELSVKPYLFIHGTLGTAWEVEGWGNGLDGKIDQLYFYHNETLALDFRFWDNLQKVSGTTTGTYTVPMKVRAAGFNGTTNGLLYDSGLVPAPDINLFMEAAFPLFPSLATDGFLRLDLTREVTLDPGHGPGSYRNDGQIVVVRS